MLAASLEVSCSNEGNKGHMVTRGLSLRKFPVDQGNQATHLDS